MSLASVLTPAYFACSLSGLACIILPFAFLRLKRQVQQLPRTAASDPAIPLALAECAAQISQLSLRLEELELRKGPLLEWAAGEPSALNLNRRGQVLRLYRRGDSIAHIASALGLSTGEVALIVKVQEMVPPGRHSQNPTSEL
jgi:hypothetical protein